MGRGASEQKTVLVVDDYDEIRFLTRQALESFGYRVLEASSGAEAVQVAQADSPDLILLDLSMPAMDGFATIHQLRRLLGMRDVPVIAFSAHTAREIREDALAAGCREFITKPVHIEKLKSVVERHLPPA
ncbi:MAG: two-component system, cell cycle response regulator DivK [Acidobacteriota bacterium]|jgi:CheY-like chemotaxis protein|nr:two-component system, cell cycle response regulator DivK [Acidobacteriota bacterium]